MNNLESNSSFQMKSTDINHSLVKEKRTSSNIGINCSILDSNSDSTLVDDTCKVNHSAQKNFSEQAKNFETERDRESNEPRDLSIKKANVFGKKKASISPQNDLIENPIPSKSDPGKQDYPQRITIEINIIIQRPQILDIRAVVAEMGVRNIAKNAALRDCLKT